MSDVSFSVGQQLYCKSVAYMMCVNFKMYFWTHTQVYMDNDTLRSCINITPGVFSASQCYALNNTSAIYSASELYALKPGINKPECLSL